MNPSTALALVIVDALCRLGVRHAVLCPGSRSSALAYALAAADTADTADTVAAAGARGGLQLHVRVDERSAGFLALGLAKESGVPAVVVTTSGTAVANLHPAVLEAAHSGVPLVVLSADRPHELRGTGANQTTDQVKLFGDAVRLFAEIPAPERRTGQVGAWRNVMARAVAAARGSLDARPGPVQVNVAFREPLVPDGDPAAPAWPEPLTGDAGLTRVQARSRPDPVQLDAGPRTVVLAGDGAGAGAAELARAAGWPLLAEPSSGARLTPSAVGPYRLLLDHPALGARIERVVVFGRPTLSRPVSRLLARDGVEVVVVSGRQDWTDAAGRAARVVGAVSPPPALAGDPGRAGRDRGDWSTAWCAAAVAAVAAIDAVLDAEAADGVLTGPLVAREVAAALLPGQALVAGSSNAVRDLDLAAHLFAAPFGSGAPTVLANRGLAGIDGTLSTAAGVALARAATGRATPVRALVGDLTFVHDAAGLASGPAERRPHLQVVLLDDDGGGIFELLEPGARAASGPGEAAVFERVFATPTTVDVPSLVAAFGAGYTDAGDLTTLRAALRRQTDGVSVVHVRAARSGRRQQAERIAAAARAAVDAAL